MSLIVVWDTRVDAEIPCFNLRDVIGEEGVLPARFWHGRYINNTKALDLYAYEEGRGWYIEAPLSHQAAVTLPDEWFLGRPLSGYLLEQLEAEGFIEWTGLLSDRGHVSGLKVYRLLEKAYQYGSMKVPEERPRP